MRRILFHYSVFNRGGAEKSTMRLMNLFVKNGWEVYFVLNFRGGDMEAELPKEIHKEYLARYPISRYQRKGVSIYLYRAIDALHTAYKCLALRRIRFDAACVGLQGLDPFFVCKAVRAKKRLLFIRNDLSKLALKDKIVSNIEKYRQKLDHLICVSKTAKESVDQCVPSMKDRSVVIYNVLCKEEMEERLCSAENPYRPTELPKLVTVCRMNDSAKALFRSLDICEKLLEQGYRFEWYFVGDGADLDRMKEYVRGRLCEDFVFFEGAKQNPFPYYKYATLVAVLSYHEGLCGVVNEAKVSGAAVIATEFSGIHEQITHGKNGWITANNEAAILDGLRTLLDNPKLIERLRNTDYPEAILNDRLKYEKFVNLLG